MIEFYLPLLKKLGVSAVVRLNKDHYDKTVFTKNEINHFDFYFGDGTTPEEKIVQNFLNVVENEKGMGKVEREGGINDKTVFRNNDIRDERYERDGGGGHTFE